ncbi:hypothetical protein Q8723_13155, partial [Streptomyces cacaoi]
MQSVRASWVGPTGSAGVPPCALLPCPDGRRSSEGEHMMHAAHRLYERLGFVRTPERDWQP